MHARLSIDFVIWVEYCNLTAIKDLLQLEEQRSLLKTRLQPIRVQIFEICLPLLWSLFQKKMQVDLKTGNWEGVGIKYLWIGISYLLYSQKKPVLYLL